MDKVFDSHEKKLGFVCIWFTFAFALYLLNRFVGNNNKIRRKQAGAEMCQVQVYFNFSKIISYLTHFHQSSFALSSFWKGK